MIRRPRSTQSRGQDLFESRHFVAARHPVATRFPFHGRDRRKAHPWSSCSSRHRAGDRPPRRGLPSAPGGRGARAREPTCPEQTEGSADVGRRGGSRAHRNLPIAGVTFGTALATGSSAMIAEGIHSLVDTGDGRSSGSVSAASRRGPDPAHPVGHGQGAVLLDGGRGRPGVRREAACRPLRASLTLGRHGDRGARREILAGPAWGLMCVGRH
jgi:hypothetical protein